VSSYELFTGVAGVSSRGKGKEEDARRMCSAGSGASGTPFRPGWSSEEKKKRGTPPTGGEGKKRGRPPISSTIQKKREGWMEKKKMGRSIK